MEGRLYLLLIMILSKAKLYGFTLQTGYKSTGYAIGEQLNKGLIIRGGMTFKLGNKSL